MRRNASAARAAWGGVKAKRPGGRNVRFHHWGRRPAAHDPLVTGIADPQNVFPAGTPVPEEEFPEVSLAPSTAGEFAPDYSTVVEETGSDWAWWPGGSGRDRYSTWLLPPIGKMDCVTGLCGQDLEKGGWHEASEADPGMFFTVPDYRFLLPRVLGGISPNNNVKAWVVPTLLGVGGYFLLRGLTR